VWSTEKVKTMCFCDDEFRAVKNEHHAYTEGLEKLEDKLRLVDTRGHSQVQEDMEAYPFMPFS
jgi:hypothetical protein